MRGETRSGDEREDQSFLGKIYMKCRRGLPRERKVLEKEKETRALLSSVKPIGVNCQRLVNLGLGFYLRSEGDSVKKDQPGEAQRKQDTRPGDFERPFRVTSN